MKQVTGQAMVIAGLLLLAGCGHSVSERAPNVGPCPASMALADAARLVELKGEKEIFPNIGFTGEILDVRGYCRYSGSRPITMQIEIDFAFGRGPSAEGNEQTYDYFVSVTRADQAVVDTARFAVTARFADGQEKLLVTESVNGIVIPRANETISGGNFEVITGFILSDAQLAFNQMGKRFRIDADTRPTQPSRSR